MARLSKKNEALLKAVQKQAARKQAAAEAAEATEAIEANKATSSASANQNGSEDTFAPPTQPKQVYTPSLSRSSSAVGLGVDLVEIDRMEKALERTPRIVERVFTIAEREYAWSKSRPATHYAAFFAAREATLKALGTGFAGMDFADVEVVHNENGKPEILLHNNAKEVAKKQGIVDIQVSLSHTHQMAVASVVAIKEQSSPPKVEYLDPMEELTRRFKELRSLLDDIGAGDVITASQKDEQEVADVQGAQAIHDELIQAEGQAGSIQMIESEQDQEQEQEPTATATQHQNHTQEPKPDLESEPESTAASEQEHE